MLPFENYDFGFIFRLKPKIWSYSKWCPINVGENIKKYQLEAIPNNAL